MIFFLCEMSPKKVIYVCSYEKDLSFMSSLSEFKSKISVKKSLLKKVDCTTSVKQAWRIFHDFRKIFQRLHPLQSKFVSSTKSMEVVHVAERILPASDKI